MVINDALGDIFHAYAKNLIILGLTCSFINNDNCSSSYSDNPLSILDIRGKNRKGSQKIEHDKYLQQPLILFDGEFDIFGWWNTSESHSYKVV